MTPDVRPVSRRRILAATAGAAVVAGVVLVTVVLPAEYGIDPLGTGRALGLTALAGVVVVDEASVVRALPAVEAPGRPPAGYAEDVYTVELRPFEGVEYKYRLEEGASLVYTWEASTAVGYEFHGEADGLPPEEYESYALGEGTTASGTFTAARPGIHGWFWENPGLDRITLTLRSAGFYSSSTEYRDGERIQRSFPAAP